jgi:hypothetical protein
MVCAWMTPAQPAPPQECLEALALLSVPYHRHHGLFITAERDLGPHLNTQLLRCCCSSPLRPSHPPHYTSAYRLFLSASFVRNRKCPRRHRSVAACSRLILLTVIRDSGCFNTLPGPVPAFPTLNPPSPPIPGFAGLASLTQARRPHRVHHHLHHHHYL